MLPAGELGYLEPRPAESRGELDEPHALAARKLENERRHEALRFGALGAERAPEALVEHALVGDVLIDEVEPIRAPRAG